MSGDRDGGALAGGGHRSGTSVLEAAIGDLVERRVAEMLPGLVRELLAREARHAPTWCSKEEAHRRGYPAPSTLRALQASGVLSKGRRGRVNLGELEALMARGGPPAAPAPAAPANLAAERARRAAAELKRGGPRG